MDLTKVLHEFPALWAVLGLVGGTIFSGLASVIVFRRYGAVLTGANDKLVDIQKKQLEMMGSTLSMQKTHYEAELDEVKRDRDTYKKSYHDARDNWQKESIGFQLRIQELEARPDISKLYEFEKQSHDQREKFYEKLSETMREITKMVETVLTRLQDHDKRAVAFLAEHEELKRKAAQLENRR